MPVLRTLEEIENDAVEQLEGIADDVPTRDLIREAYAAGRARGIGGAVSALEGEIEKWDLNRNKHVVRECIEAVRALSDDHTDAERFEGSPAPKEAAGRFVSCCASCRRAVPTVRVTHPRNASGWALTEYLCGDCVAPPSPAPGGDHG